MNSACVGDACIRFTTNHNLKLNVTPNAALYAFISRVLTLIITVRSGTPPGPGGRCTHSMSPESMLGPRLAGGRCGYWCAPARLHMQPVPGGGAVACGARTLDWPCALRLPLCCGHVQSRPSANVFAERLAPHAQVPRLDPLLLGAQARGRLDDDAKAPARASMPTDCLKVFGLQVG